jgi:hypothetical protein
MERFELDELIRRCENWAQRSSLEFRVDIGNAADNAGLYGAEQAMGLKLPGDFRAWYGICNGFECRVGPLAGVQILAVPSLVEMVDGSQRLREILSEAYEDSGEVMPAGTSFVFSGLYMNDTFLMGPMKAGDRRQEAVPVVKRDEWALDAAWPQVANSFDEWLRSSLEAMALKGRFEYYESELP